MQKKFTRCYARGSVRVRIVVNVLLWGRCKNVLLHGLAEEVGLVVLEELVDEPRALPPQALRHGRGVKAAAKATVEAAHRGRRLELGPVRHGRLA